MSNDYGSYGYTTPLPAPRAAAAPPTPPRLLPLAVGAALAAAALYLVTAVLAFVSGRAAVESAIRVGVGADLQDLVNTVAGPAIDAAYGTIKTRAMIIAFFAVVAVVLALVALRASLVARIVVAVSLLLALAVTARAVTDIFPGAAKGTGWAAVALSLVAVVMLFLPAVNRYATARRARAAA